MFPVQTVSIRMGWGDSKGVALSLAGRRGAYDLQLNTPDIKSHSRPGGAQRKPLQHSRNQQSEADSKGVHEDVLQA